MLALGVLLNPWLPWEGPHTPRSLAGQMLAQAWPPSSWGQPSGRSVALLPSVCVPASSLEVRLPTGRHFWAACFLLARGDLLPYQAVVGCGPRRTEPSLASLKSSRSPSS